VWPAARCGAHRWLPLGRAWGPVGETRWKVEGLGIGIIVFISFNVETWMEIDILHM
jgi:hypothetical protein